MNNVVLIGRLTRDPELRYIPVSGTATSSFTIAVDRGLSKEKKQEMESKNQPTADFIRIVTWGKTAENCANYLAKGRLVAVQGRIQTGTYEKDGVKVYTTDINAHNVQFLGGGSNNQQQGGHPTNDSAPFSPDDGFQTWDDDIPF